MVKVISLSNKAYEILKDIKQENESFSDVVIRIKNKNKKNISEFFGILKDEKEIIKNLKKVYKERKSFKLRNVEL